MIQSQNTDYEIAEIKKEDEKKIDALEKVLSEEHQCNVVLIAYQKKSPKE